MALLIHRSARAARSGLTGRTRAFCLACVLTLLSWAQAQVTREYDLKAVFLLNFAQFVEWPTEAFAGAEDPFIIAVLGADPFGGALERVIRNERVHARPVLLHRFQRVEDAKPCHILFVSASESRRLPQVVKGCKGQPILTVSDTEGFASQGGIIQFVTENAKIRLRINNDAARAARLLISAKLLRVAEVVGNPESPR